MATRRSGERGSADRLVKGAATVNGALLQSGDGLAIEAAETVSFEAEDSAVEALLFDLR